MGQGFTVGNLASGTRATFSTNFAIPGPYTSDVSYTFNATADNSNAVVESNEVNNARSFNVTIRGKSDLTITNLTADKAVYNPGETVVIQATVSNKSSIAAPAYNICFRTPLLGDLQWLRGTGLAANSSQIFTFSFAAPSNFTADTVLNLEALADASYEIGEYREDNNSASLSFSVKALLPDLTGSIATDKAVYEAGETITATFTVRNDGLIPVSGFDSRWLIRTLGDPAYEQGPLDQAGTSTIGANSSISHTVAFTAPSRTAASTLQIELDIDYDNKVPESDETNNLIQKTVSINEIRSDLSIVSDNISSYFVDKDVIIAATIHNQSAEDLPSTSVKLEFGSEIMTEEIPIPAFNNNLVVFKVHTPSIPGSYNVRISADPDDVIVEGDESNNIISRSITVGPENRIPMPDPDTPILEQNFNTNGKVLPPLSGPASSLYHTWQEYRLEDGNYNLKSFWMRLNTSLSVSPDPRIAIAGSPDVMESGFGVEAVATTMITTNYDYAEKLVGPQMVYCFYPETTYGCSPFINYAEVLEVDAGSPGEFSLRWRYPISPFSTIGSHLHFTPLWIPDGSYPVLAQAFYAWSPAGQLVDYRSDPVTILGDMYDRVTVVRR